MTWIPRLTTYRSRRGPHLVEVTTFARAYDSSQSATFGRAHHRIRFRGRVLSLRLSVAVAVMIDTMRARGRGDVWGSVGVNGDLGEIRQPAQHMNIERARSIHV